jgi:diacylglycerol kinase
VAELFNSALERITDLVSPEQNELAKKAKDYAAGAVLMVAIWAIIVFLIIALPRLLLNLML